MDERAFDPRFEPSTPGDFALMLAHAKADALFREGGDRWLLCADQVGVLEVEGHPLPRRGRGLALHEAGGVGVTPCPSAPMMPPVDEVHPTRHGQGRGHQTWHVNPLNNLLFSVMRCLDDPVDLSSEAF